ncbi:MAG TPA: hypothetical protein VMJ74_05225, partial [Pseudomonadales bacterium]|nr:hypothetical protein [Pseudomonadales bacterium]
TAPSPGASFRYIRVTRPHTRCPTTGEQCRHGVVSRGSGSLEATMSGFAMEDIVAFVVSCIIKLLG